MITSRGFTTPLRVALWMALLIAAGGWVIQGLARFPHPSRGASLTALMFAAGSILGGLSALWAFVELARRPTARTGGAIALTVVNSMLLVPAGILAHSFVTGD